MLESVDNVAADCTRRPDVRRAASLVALEDRVRASRAPASPDEAAMIGDAFHALHKLDDFTARLRAAGATSVMLEDATIIIGLPADTGSRERLFAISSSPSRYAMTGLWCPPPPNGTALTYENFGKPFVEAYCTRCHDSKLVGAARHGATSFHDFDTLFGIKAVKAHIGLSTASGPAATNTSMPPDGAKPSLEERQQLGEWIACGLPSDP